MKINEQSGFLEFSFSEENDGANFPNEMREIIKKYKFKHIESWVEIYNQLDEKLCVCDVVDNTVFVISDNHDAIEAANLLGAKRFIYSNISVVENGVQFPRDREFLISALPNEMAIPSNFIFCVGLDQIKQKMKEHKIYSNLTHILEKHSKFTEGKL